jgi:hypothetical protein
VLELDSLQDRPRSAPPEPRRRRMRSPVLPPPRG